MKALGLPNAMCRVVDVRDREAVANAVKDAEEKYGPADCLFNNAGIARLGDITKQDPAEWDEMIDINVNGVMNGVHAVMDGMVKRRHGTIVQMSSIAGRKVYPDHTVYCGTKYFVHGMSDSLREHLAPHDVRVIVISPGIIETEVLDHVTDKTTLGQLSRRQGKDRRRHRRGPCRAVDPVRLQAAAERPDPGDLHHADPAGALSGGARADRDGRNRRRAAVVAREPPAHAELGASAAVAVPGDGGADRVRRLSAALCAVAVAAQAQPGDAHQRVRSRLELAQDLRRRAGLGRDRPHLSLHRRRAS